MPESLSSVAVARPQRSDARRNFEAVLAAAKTVFASDGADASLEDIARLAGVGIATLYRNFPTRAALLEAVYFEEVDQLCRSAADFTGMPPWEGLEGWLRRFVDYAVTKKALIDSLNRQQPAFANAATAMYAAGGPLLEAAQAAGEARPDVSIDDLMRLLIGVISVNVSGADQRERMLQLTLDGVRASR
ncbi:MAG: Transcriptional regulator, TetR family [Microbacteriaceae bacterium]|nr:Transcriptional regulator, TetR family [Microbacteriaceae bacterium]